MHDNERVIDEAEGKQTDAGDVENKTLLHAEGDILLGLRLKLFGVGEATAGVEQQQQGDAAGDRQHRKAERVGADGGGIGASEHHQPQQHRPQKGADLVEQLLQTKAAPGPLLGGGKGHDGILGRLFDGLAHALHHQQQAGGDPAVFSHQGQGRHGDDVQYIAQDHHGPVAAGAVGDAPEEVAHRVADEFSQAGDKADGPGRSPQQSQIGAADARSALVGHVRKQADDPEQDQEHHGLGKAGFFLVHLILPPVLFGSGWGTRPCSPPCCADRCAPAVVQIPAVPPG